ncbi:MAG: 1-deoxy-D-xylulose-5-phosphate reductoisomerase [Clostridia bacterium]|nr:1-deoxy-D-xylulose-5-phosphate reductoisomerase [Clostridia bacterium]
MKTISILGSTGSIGTQTLQVCRDLGIGVAALSAGSNVELLEQQIREFGVPLASVYDEKKAEILKARLADFPCTVLSGEEGNRVVATASDASVVVTAMMGMIGLKPTLAAIDAGKDIALANKETLVCAGQIVMPRAAQKGVKILPVDSEHSAIFQCLQGAGDNPVNKILLTASGGPFFGKTVDELRDMTAKDALKHPNWNMGSKITIDSSTLMNKGLEWMEAKWLFDVTDDQIEVVVHRESIIHSAVEFADHSVIAQMGVPSMYLPIKYALTYPARVQSGNFGLSLFGKTLHFYEVDEKTFSCLRLAKEASRAGGLYPTVLNGANEQAVDLFLKGKIRFLQIAQLVEEALAKTPVGDATNLDYVLEADRLARAQVNASYEKGNF